MAEVASSEPEVAISRWEYRARRLHFMTQQYDSLFCIQWNAQLNDSAFDVDVAKA